MRQIHTDVIEQDQQDSVSLMCQQGAEEAVVTASFYVLILCPAWFWVLVLEPGPLE